MVNSLTTLITRKIINNGSAIYVKIVVKSNVVKYTIVITGSKLMPKKLLNRAILKVYSVEIDESLKTKNKIFENRNFTQNMTVINPAIVKKYSGLFS